MKVLTLLLPVLQCSFNISAFFAIYSIFLQKLFKFENIQLFKDTCAVFSFLTFETKFFAGFVLFLTFTVLVCISAFFQYAFQLSAFTLAFLPGNAIFLVYYLFFRMFFCDSSCNISLEAVRLTLYDL